MNECKAGFCSAGAKCENQMFTKRKYPQLKVFSTKDCGWGLKTKEDLKQGKYIIKCC